MGSELRRRRSPPRAAAALALAVAFAASGHRLPAAPGATGGHPQIYENPWNWEHPESLVLTEEQIYRHTPYTRDWQTHSYYWLGKLDNGYVVVICPFQWIWGIIANWGLNIIVLEPGGGVYSYDSRIGEGTLKVAPTGMHIEAGATSITSEGLRHRWRIEVPGFSCDISFTSILPAWMPGSGVAFFTTGGEFYSQYSLPAPWADVTGTLTVFGRTVSAEGQCFLDTSETVLPLNRTNSEIWAFRFFSPPGTPREDRWFIGQLTSVSHPAFGSLRLPMLLVARAGSWVLTTKDFFCEPTQTATIADPPYPYPARFTVHAIRGGTQLEGSVFFDPPYYVTDVFAKLPRALRTIASWFLKRPVIYRNLARFEGKVTLPDGTACALSLAGQGEYVVSK